MSGFDSQGPRKENVIRQSRDSAELPPGILNRESNVDPEDEGILVGAKEDFGQSMTSRNNTKGLEEVRQKSFESGSYVLQQDGRKKGRASETDEYSNTKKSSIAKNSNLLAAYGSNNNSNNTYIIMINKNYNGTASGKSRQNKSHSQDDRANGS